MGVLLFSELLLDSGGSSIYCHNGEEGFITFCVYLSFRIIQYGGWEAMILNIIIKKVFSFNLGICLVLGYFMVICFR